MKPIASHPKRIPECPKCSSKDKVRYNKEHDAYFCNKCLVWLESKCDDPECDYCPGRPSKPTREE